jgi:hypothetical protein
MSRAGEISLQFGDEERVFRLTIGAWRKIQEKCDAGPPEIASRLAAGLAFRSQGLSPAQALAMGGLGRWRVDDIREVLYQGLIGGDMDPTAAGKVIRDLVDERPLGECIAIAYAVVLASVVGSPDEPLGESPGETAGPALSPTAS